MRLVALTRRSNMPTHQEIQFPATMGMWYHLHVGSSLLAAGSFVLLVGTPLALVVSERPRGWFGDGFVAILCGAILLSPLLHLIAWFALALAARDAWSVPTLTHRHVGIGWAFLASLVGFAAGVMTIPFALGGSPEGLSWIPFSLPYIPSVYAPVVLSHAVLFLFTSKMVMDSRAAKGLRFGSFTLVGLASVALVLQFLSPFLWPAFLPLAGLTALGYALASFALGRERQNLIPPPAQVLRSCHVSAAHTFTAPRDNCGEEAPESQ